MAYMTFKAFQASRKAQADLEKATGATLNHKGDGKLVTGFTYADSGAYIEDVRDDDPGRSQGRYYLCLERDEWITDDLAALEGRLYKFCLGAFDCLGKPSPKAKEIAKAFLANMAEDMTEEQLQEIDSRNREESNPDICHSHDFCDANMPMAAAFEKVMGRELNGDSEADCLLWSDAWKIAVDTGFYDEDRCKAAFEKANSDLRCDETGQQLPR